jgi:hypothetical protein
LGDVSFIPAVVVRKAYDSAASQFEADISRSREAGVRSNKVHRQSACELFEYVPEISWRILVDENNLKIRKALAKEGRQKPRDLPRPSNGAKYNRQCRARTVFAWFESGVKVAARIRLSILQRWPRSLFLIQQKTLDLVSAVGILLGKLTN